MIFRDSSDKLIEINRKDFHTDACYYSAILSVKQKRNKVYNQKNKILQVVNFS